MYEVIIPKYALKELSKIDKENNILLITVIRIAHRKEVY